MSLNLICFFHSLKESPHLDTTCFGLVWDSKEESFAIVHHADLVYIGSSVYSMFAAVADLIDVVTATNANRIIGIARDIGHIVEASELWASLDVEVFVLNSASVLFEFLKVMVVASAISAYCSEAHIVFKPVDTANPAVMIFA